ncbi:MAG: protein-methionine-sulfoxide reductase catalytic subunit MsrP [Pseudomonadaceae bacterium]|nr:protein-methionine-sulfoxide reductase catalytic subunit MsrP [Pseudomonadaceae bacterium]
MLIRSKKPGAILPSEITPETSYLNRRRLLAGIASGVVLAGCAESSASAPDEQAVASDGQAPAPGLDAITPEEIATSYNNFYEFGTGKGDPARYAHELTTTPWSVSVSGLVDKPASWALEDLLAGLTPEDRIYRFRCVEAWSMVIPWLGIPLSAVLDKVGVDSSAKYVAFETLKRPSEMRGQRSAFSGIDWPYVEGLRIDEAMHPLTTLAVGMYGKPLPNQNGAPLRLVVPWKYGFKSIKSIVGIRLTRREPPTTWNRLNAREYGFYSNVNPEVDHPRWSQASERRLPSTFLQPNRIETRMFNGYAEEVASLYSGMDLKKHY